jgi:hypothetical protein
MNEPENTKILREIKSPNIKASLINGIFNGVGFVIGSTVVIALVALVLRPFITVPVIGDMINDIIEVVESRRPQPDNDVEKVENDENTDTIEESN